MTDLTKAAQAVVSAWKSGELGLGIKEFSALEAALAAQQPCQYCNDTGDVHGLDGEWQGKCTACKWGSAQQAAQPVAWCDDGALAGGVGSVASAATKQYWARGDRVDRETAARLKHPLYAAAQPQQAEQTVWRGAARCDMCKKVITRNLYDAATRHGPWATMCASCFSFHGLGVGTGRGQHYKQQPDGLFVKIAG